MRDAAAARKVDPLGPMSWEQGLIDHWMEFSEGEYYASFIGLNPRTAEEFAEWLGGKAKRSHPSTRPRGSSS
jgi:hypothetical protein